MSEFHYIDEKNAQILLALLKAYGIRHAVVSPGTTNMTFVASMQYDSWFKMYSAVDERSAAYMACGLAAETGEPVILSCTGATASRNYLPGLTEAYYRKLPVLAVTSSQPVSRVGHLVPQVTDRSSAPNDTVTKSVLLSLVNTDDDIWNCEIKCNEALLALKRHGGGPVHINLETSYSRNFSVAELPAVRKIARITCSDDFPELPEGRIAVFVGAHKKWSDSDTEAVDAFCQSNNAVVFCDHTSGYKGKYRVLNSVVFGQMYYHSEATDIDILIHIGEISGDYYTAGLNTKQVWRISPDGEIRDTFRQLRYVFEMPEAEFFRHYMKNDRTGDDSYLTLCRSEHQMVHDNIPELPFSNIWIAGQISSRLPDNSVLHLGILNTLRSWNLFEIPLSVSASCNVGGFGIDGDISSLIGASLADRNRICFGVFGDLAFFYDMNALGNRHVGNNVRILLINNGRGTEFRNFNNMGSMFGEDADAFIAAAGHYGNQSPALVRHYAEDLGFEYLSASSKEEFKAVSPMFLRPGLTDKPIFLEVFTSSAEESDALQKVLSCVVPDEVRKKMQISSVAHKILGRHYDTVHSVYNRLKPGRK